MASLESTREDLDFPHRYIRRWHESQSCIAVLLIVSLGIAGSIDVHATTSTNSAEVSPSSILLWRAGLLSDEELAANPFLTEVRDIDDLLALDAEFHKYRAIHSMLMPERSTDSRLDEVLEQSEEIEDRNLRRSLQQHVLHAMAHQQPERALDIALSFPSDNTRFLISGVFLAWANSDLDAAADRARKLEEPNRTVALKSILPYAYQWSDNQQREFTLELGQDYDVDGLYGRSYSQLSVEELKQAWISMIDSRFLDTHRHSHLLAIASAWLDISNYQFQFISSICHSMPNVYERSEILNFLLKQVSETDLRPAFELAVECHENQMDDPLITVVRAWGHREPLEALQAISNMELTSLRYPLRRIVVDEWARTVPNEILRNPELLPNDLRDWGVSRAVVEIAWDSPRRAARLISRVHVDYMDEVEAIIAERLSHLSWKVALQWLVTRSKRAKVSVNSWIEVLRDVAEEDPQRAFRIARHHSLKNEEDGLEFIVVMEVAYKDVRQAKLFLAQMSDNRAKFVASRGLGEFLVALDRFTEAIELRDLLIENERSEYLQSLFDFWAASDPVQLFMWVNDAEPSDLRHRGALALEKADARRKSLSDAEMQQIRSLALPQEQETVR